MHPFRPLALLLVLAGCCAAPPPARVTHESLNAVLWMQASAEYAVACETVYAAARSELDRALADAARAAALEQGEGAAALPPAVVFDVDETVLDNQRFQARLAATGTTFSVPAFSAWCREEQAGAVPGALEFCRYASSKGVFLVFLTNRDAAVADATRSNLAKLGFPADAARAAVIGKSGESDKGPRRREVCGKHRVVLLVGDQLQDFVSVPKGSDNARRRELAAANAARWGRDWFALPNPSYGDWERALVDPKGTDEENLKRKFGALRQ
ncbi:MAG: hypothetical protein IT452_06295 [Planctomycetia bacterium]|nr:hypothetical protein [Planctomycetia bacterium]